MYNPPAFVEARDAELQAIMRAASLPLLVSPGLNGLLASHLPLSFVAPDRLIGHLAKANTHWRDFDPAQESLAVFTAADGYVSPSWYATKAETGKVVPTWNYQAVHVTGRLEIIDDAAEKHTIVTQLTERFENARAKPWAVSDAPDGYIAGQLKGIVGVVLHIRTIDGKVKLSQNRSEQDQLGVIHGLETENPPLAAAMRQHRANKK
jgi:transcriptional regulator